MGSWEGRMSRISSGVGTIRGLAMAVMLAGMLLLPVRAEAQCISISRSFPQLAFAGGETQFPINVTISSTCEDVRAIGLREQLPAGWIWKGVTADEENLPEWNTESPTAGGVVEYLWIQDSAGPASFPITFTYFVEIPEIPEGTGQNVNIAGSALFREKDGAQQISTSSSTLPFVVPPTIQLIGNPFVLLACGDEYVELGATATDPAEGDITDRIIINSNVDTNRAGVYEVVYGVTNAFEQTVEVRRAVTITDTEPPSITLLGEADITLECGNVFTDPGTEVFDECEGVLSANTTGSVNNRVPGNYTLTYVATDSGGNSTSPVQRIVRVVDTRKPVITLIGGLVTVECGQAFVDPGFQAADFCEGNLSANVVVNQGSVNTSRVGSYTVTYNVTDAAGNRADQVTRTVQVRDTTRPAITLRGANPVTLTCGTPFVDPGSSASDACAGALPVSVDSSQLNVNVPGSYRVRYSANDGVTQTRIVERTVNVVDSVSPVITLNGDSVEFVECGSEYIEPGAVITDNCDAELALLVAGQFIYTNVRGAYRVEYSTSDDAGNVDDASRLVVVEDTTPPVVTLLGDSEVTVECTTAFTDPGATAEDTCDGDLTSFVVVGGDRVIVSVPGEYVVTYTATDSNGNTATPITRTVNVVDSRPPTVRVTGGNITLFCGEEFIDFGATATDECDGNLTDSISVSGATLDTGIPGLYPVVYSVRDAEGNLGSATRQVTVLEDGCAEEGEGEGTPAEGEGEGAVELPDCAPESVSLIEPSSNVLVPVGTAKVNIDLKAQVRFAAEVDCEVPSSVTVLYAIDGVVVGTSTDAEGGYPAVASLGVGEYVLSVTALPADRGTAVSEVRALNVLEAFDADANGILDNPFTNLPGEGDFWAANVAAVGCTRTVALQSWMGDGLGGTIDVTLQNPVDPTQSIQVSVLRNVLQPGEQGVLIATLACSLASLFDPYDASGLVDSLPAGPIAGEAYVDISVIVSNDGGDTYEDLDVVEVEETPAVEVLYLSNGLARGSTFRAYPTDIMPGSLGLQLKPGAGAWTRLGIENVVSSLGRLSAKFRHLSAFGVFVALDLPADLSANKDEINFGSVVQGGTLEQMVTITNSGDAELNGAPTIEGNGFSLTDSSAYTLGSGESRTFVVQYTAPGVGTHVGTLRFSGGAGGDVTIALTGVGTLFDKGNSATGCGSVSESGSGRAADIVLVLGVLALLVIAARVRRPEN